MDFQQDLSYTEQMHVKSLEMRTCHVISGSSNTVECNMTFTVADLFMYCLCVFLKDTHKREADRDWELWFHSPKKSNILLNLAFGHFG